MKAITLQKRWQNGEFKTGFELSSKEKQSERGRKGGATCARNKVGVCSENYGEAVAQNMSGLVANNTHWWQSENHSKNVARRNKEPHECPECGRIIKGLGPLGVHLKSHRRNKDASVQ